MTTLSQTKSIKSQRGYTLLFAVLTATLVLGVAVFVLGVSKKQYALSVVARDSTFAFYSADSGIECAVAAEYNGDIDPVDGGPITCNGTSVTLPAFGSPVYPTPTAMTGTITQAFIGVPLINDTCAVVIFTKGTIGTDLATVIDSRGYNYCDMSTVMPDVDNLRTVERALRLTLLGV